MLYLFLTHADESFFIIVNYEHVFVSLAQGKVHKTVS